jgi:hypothetical protein
MRGQKYRSHYTVRGRLNITRKKEKTPAKVRETIKRREAAEKKNCHPLNEDISSSSAENNTDRHQIQVR